MVAIFCFSKHFEIIALMNLHALLAVFFLEALILKRLLALATAAGDETCTDAPSLEDNEAYKQLQDRVRGLEQKVIDQRSTLRSCLSNGGAETVDADADAGVWLAVGIPTIARREDEDYLLRTLESYYVQLPSSPSDPLWGRIKIVVMNNHLEGERHAVYEQAERKYLKSARGRAHFDFERISAPPLSKVVAAAAPAPAGAGRGRGRPTSRQKKQTRHVVHLMRYVAQQHRPHVYIFAEDDFVLCRQGLLAFEYLVRKATSYFDDWLSIRVSFGLNGLLIPGRDLPTLASYAESHQARRPVDHLAVEWFAGETPEAAAYKGRRPHVAYKYNLLDHIGEVSTLRRARGGSKMNYPGCWQLLGQPTNFDVESYDPDACPHDDVSPCVPEAEGGGGSAETVFLSL